MSTFAQSVPFFVAGGTLPAESTSYVERSADSALLAALTAGKFCYVLNSRQMGKSSLCVRTMRRLSADGVRTAFVDLTKIGGKNVTPEQWYAGIAMEIGRSLDLRAQILAYWKENGHVSPVQRLFGSLREVVLEKFDGPVAVFFDEIDATRSLSFSADEFFAAIRECYNRRVHDETYKRLTFCLLGVAVPSDLISSPTSTPFNVGERIYLRDFTLDEAMALAEGLGSDRDSQSLLKRAFYWTHGHPYLTQSLCTAIGADAAIRSPDDVDALVKRDLFEPKARETNINLADVANRALHAGDLEANPEKFRADLLSAYESAWKGKILADDESNRVAALLKLSGIMRSEDNQLNIRNRIYEHVFDKAWIRENMPGQELRRQSRAFWLGVLRTTGIAGVVVGVFVWLAISNARLAKTASDQRDRLDYDLYIAKANAMRAAWEDNDPGRLKSLLAETASSRHRGWEWAYWSRIAGLETWRVDYESWCEGIPSPDDRCVLVIEPKGSFLLDARTGKTLETYSKMNAAFTAAWSDDGRRLLVGVNMQGLVVADRETGLLRTAPQPGYSSASLQPFEAKGDYFVGTQTAENHTRALIWRFSDLKVVATISPPGNGYRYPPIFMPDGHSVVGGELIEGRWCLTERAVPAGNLIRSYELPSSSSSAGDTVSYLVCFGQGKFLCAGTSRGKIVVWRRGSTTPAWQLVPDGSAISQVHFSRDSKRMMSETAKGELKVWDTATRTPIFSLPGVFGSLSHDGQRIYAGGMSLRAIDIAKYRDHEEFQLPASELLIIGGLLPRSDRMAVLAGYNVRILDTAGRLLRVYDNRKIGYDPAAPPVPDQSKSRILVSPYRCGLLTVQGGIYRLSSDGTTFRSAFPLAVPGIPGYIAFSETGKYIAVLTSGANRHMVLCDAGTGLLSSWQPMLPFAPDNIAVSAGGGYLVASSADGAVSIWNLDSRTRRDLGKVGSYTAVAYSFSHDGTRIAMSSVQSVLIYDLRTGALKMTLPGSIVGTNSTEFSPDDTRLLTAGGDRTVRLWDLNVGSEVLRLGGFSNPVVNAQFTQDGRNIVTFEQNGSIRIYRSGVEKAEPVAGKLN